MSNTVSLEITNISTLIKDLLVDRQITASDQEKIKQAIQLYYQSFSPPQPPNKELLLWIICPNRRNMTGREFVLEFCKRFYF